MAELNTLEFLNRLARAGGKANMWEIGDEMGLSRDQTEALSLDLMSQGSLEMVNLSGGVRLTEAGASAASAASGSAGDGAGAGLAGLVHGLEAAGGLGLSGAAAADLAADLATLKAQLARSRPLPEVVKATAAAVAQALAASGRPEAADLAKAATSLAG